jgi:hypothetical protein
MRKDVTSMDEQHDHQEMFDLYALYALDGELAVEELPQGNALGSFATLSSAGCVGCSFTGLSSAGSAGTASSFG